MVAPADVQSLAKQHRKELRQRVTAEALAAAVGQVRIELMGAINSRTDQLNSIAAATQSIAADAPSAATTSQNYRSDPDDLGRMRREG